MSKQLATIIKTRVLILPLAVVYNLLKAKHNNNETIIMKVRVMISPLIAVHNLF